MAIDKGLYAAPLGIADAAAAEPDLEIEIEDPESVSIRAGGMEIDIEKEEEGADAFDANLAEFMDDGELESLSSELLSDFTGDVDSRKDWMDAYAYRTLGWSVRRVPSNAYRSSSAVSIRIYC